MWKAELIQKEWRNKAERWLKQPHTKEKKMDKWSPILQRKESPRWKAQGAKTLCQLILGHTWLDLSVCCYFFWKPIVEFRNHWIDTFVCVHSLSPVFSRALRLQVTCWTPGCPVNLKELDGCVPIELDLVREPWQCGELEHGTFDILHHVSLFSNKHTVIQSLFWDLSQWDGGRGWQFLHCWETRAASGSRDSSCLIGIRSKNETGLTAPAPHKTSFSDLFRHIMLRLMLLHQQKEETPSFLSLIYFSCLAWLLPAMHNDETIWACLGEGFCSFKVRWKTPPQDFCSSLLIRRPFQENIVEDMLFFDVCNESEKMNWLHHNHIIQYIYDILYIYIFCLYTH